MYNVYVIYELLYLSQIQFVFGVSNAFYTVYTSYQLILIHKCLGIKVIRNKIIVMQRTSGGGVVLSNVTGWCKKRFVV